MKTISLKLDFKNITEQKSKYLKKKYFCFLDPLNYDKPFEVEISLFTVSSNSVLFIV